MTILDKKDKYYYSLSQHQYKDCFCTLLWKFKKANEEIMN